MIKWFCLYCLPQGLYCISVNCMDNAEAQFTTALRVSPEWFMLLFFFFFSTAATRDSFSCLTHVACCFPAHYTPGAVDIHCNQPGQCLHQGRKQTPGGEFVGEKKHHDTDTFFGSIECFCPQWNIVLFLVWVHSCHVPYCVWSVWRSVIAHHSICVNS